MSQFYTSNKDAITFQSICLKHFQKILDISTKEFTGGYWRYVATGNVTEKVYETDKRKEFCQSVEILAYILEPYFDSKIKEKYKEYEKKFDDIDSMKKLFRELSALLYRLDYLKGRIGVIDVDADDLEDLEDD